MPMSFPDMRSLLQAAEDHDFRKPTEGETEQAFRSALADHVQSRDIVESMEIRTGKGWDQFNESENLELVNRNWRKHNGRP